MTAILENGLARGKHFLQSICIFQLTSSQICNISPLHETKYFGNLKIRKYHVHNVVHRISDLSQNILRLPFATNKFYITKILNNVALNSWIHGLVFTVTE